MIKGKIPDPKGNALADATVAICEDFTEIIQIPTDNNGEFRCNIDSKYDGHLLTIKVSKAGFEPGQKPFRDTQELKLTLNPLPDAPKPRPSPPSPEAGSPRKRDAEDHKAPAWLKPVVAVVVVAACALIVWAIIPKKVAVPNLDRMSIQEATNALAAVGLGWAIETVKADDSSADPGTVTSATPAAGTRLSSGKEVKLTVDPGVEVPDLVSIDVPDAEKMLTGLGFKSQIENHGVSGLAAYQVTQQSPPAHDFAKKGGTINLTVNFRKTSPPSGNTLLVPQLLNLPAAQLATIRSSNPQLRFAEKGLIKTASYAPGTVCQQSPAAGQKVSPNATVSYWIAAKP